MQVLTGDEASAAAGWAKAFTSERSDSAERKGPREAVTFEAVVQLFHPWQSDDGTVAISWKDLADTLRLAWPAELNGMDLLLRGEIYRRFESGLSEGHFGRGPAGDRVRAHLDAALARVTSPDMPINLYYETAAATDGRPSTLFIVALSDVAEVRSNFVYRGTKNPIPGPEWSWPADRSWLVHTDYDAVATDIYGPVELSDLILADEVLQALPLAGRQIPDG